MNGQPVWLASVSRCSIITDRFVATGKWTPGQFREAEDVLREALAGVGNPTRERLFRMNLTLCLHRALTDDEVAMLPGGCPVTPQNLAGGPIEVLWESEPGGLSTQPCANPTRVPFPNDPFNTDLWLPIDCGECPSCRARAAIEIER